MVVLRCPEQRTNDRTSEARYQSTVLEAAMTVQTKEQRAEAQRWALYIQRLEAKNEQLTDEIEQLKLALIRATAENAQLNARRKP